MITDFPIPVIFAHRGASAHAPENTLAAFELAVKQGAPAIEFDVKLTCDRQVIIIHDQTLDRTTNGTGPVVKYPLAALRELETVGRKVLLNIELTIYATPFDALVPEVATLVKKHNIQQRVIFSSFYFSNLLAAQRLLPEVPCGLLFETGISAWHQKLASRFMNLQAEHPYTTDVTSQMVQRVHASGRRVHVWTVNDPQDMRRLRACGADGIFTDDPLLAFENFK